DHCRPALRGGARARGRRAGGIARRARGAGVGGGGGARLGGGRVRRGPCGGAVVDRSVAAGAASAGHARHGGRVPAAGGSAARRGTGGRRGGAADARLEVERALRQGDSSAATLVLAGELLAGAGRYRDAERAYRAAARDSALGALAIYRRARILARLGDAGASEALSGFAQSFPADTAAPTALYVLGDMLADRGDWGGAARWFGELIARYAADLRASLARFRLAAQALR